jgi:RNA polymerase sigma factor (sigma-70 family)
VILRSNSFASPSTSLARAGDFPSPFPAGPSQGLPRGGPVQSAHERWMLAAQHRPALEATARASGLNFDDAQDVASEAIMRAAGKEDLDLSTAHAWLRVVVRRLAIDVHRSRLSPPLMSRVFHADPPAEEPQTRVADRAEASWLAGHVAALPPRQRTVLEMRADGRSAAQIAADLDCSYKTVESLTSRARGQLRQVLAASLSALVAATCTLRRIARTGGAVVATAVVAAAMLLTQHQSVSTHGLARPSPVVSDREVSAGLVRLAVAPGVGLRSPTPRSVHAPVGRTASRDAVLDGTTAGPVRIGQTTLERQNDDESLTDSAVGCLRHGVDVNAEHVGCRTAGQ